MMREADFKIHSRVSRSVLTILVLLTTACTTPAPPPTSTTSPTLPPTSPSQPPAPRVQAPTSTPPPKAPLAAKAPASGDAGPKSAPASAPTAPGVAFRPAAFADLPGWREDAVAEAWSAFIASCGALAAREPWRDVCALATRVTNPTTEAARRFFEQNFKPWLVTAGDGSDEGLITGYYEPLLRGARKPGGRYRYPLYGVPDDLISVDLADVHPELKGLRLRGRIEGRRVVPYYDRAQIEGGVAPVRGKELLWVDDAVELFFLHVQGSGRITLENGESVRVGYADQNGYPYRSIGRALVERGELTLDQASMQGIKAWAREHPAELPALLAANASYVFFRELPGNASGPPGSLGVPLNPRRSVAVDSRYVPLGAPVYLATTWPNTTRPLNRLAMAQDTGSAIRGAVRADFFWGYGDPAAREAGRMKQRLRMWALLPNGYPIPAPTAGPAQPPPPS